jgi:hypothetical protein
MKPLQRRYLGGEPTTWITFKLPQKLHEGLRSVAFQEGKSVSLLLTEVIQKLVSEGGFDESSGLRSG